MTRQEKTSNTARTLFFLRPAPDICFSGISQKSEKRST